MSSLKIPVDFDACERELCRRSLVDFIKQAWRVIEPGQPYVHGWHIDAIADHLSAVSRGEITRLLINIPPGTMKSLATCVFWPAWEWTTKPATRYVCASHSQEHAIRDNVRMRRLVASDWYQRLWPLKLTDDQNAKTKFENEMTGFRQAMAVASMTGARGDRVIWDDPHSVEDALSDAKRTAALRVFDETLPTRLNNPDRSVIVVIMQRLHERDVSGHILERDLGYTHLCLPMEFEPDRRCSTSIGFTDPRNEPGELLFPARFSREVVERDKKAMGAMAVAGQFQQRPAPRGGGMIQADRLEIGDPGPIQRAVRYWDKAGTDGGGCYTAGVKVGRDADGVFWVLDVVRGQWAAAERERHIKQAAQIDGTAVPVWVEQEPGSGGKESAEATIRNLAGFVAHADRVTGAKETRAEPFAAQVASGNVKLARGEWNRAFIDECATFPVGRFKDQVDAASGAFVKLTQTEVPRSVGLQRNY